MHRHNPALPPLLLIIQRNCGRHHHQRRHRKEPALQYHHYYFRRQHHLSKPSDINIFQRPIFYRPIGKLLSQVHYQLFIAIADVIIINGIIESGCRCIDIIIIIIAAASLPPTGRHNIFQRSDLLQPADNNYSSFTSITNHLRQLPSSSSSTASSEGVDAAADDYYCSSSSSFSTGPFDFSKSHRCYNGYREES